MSPPLYPPSRPQSIAEVLDTGFRIFQISLPRCVGYGVLSVLAGQLPNIYDLATGRPIGQFGRGDPIWFLWYIVGAVAMLVLWTAMMLRQAAIASGRATTLSAEARVAFARLPYVILLLLACFLAIAMGTLLLVLPGLYLAVALTLSWPALVLTRQDVLSAMRYSLGLIRRNWWRTTLIFAVALAVVFMFYSFGLILSALILRFAGAEDIAVVTAVSAAVVVAMGAVASPFMCALLLATFGDLQVRREGTDLERRMAGATAV
jgi:hypothetical protein